MFNSNGYTQHAKQEAAAAASMKQRLASIEKGAKVLVYNNAFRRDEWHTVETVSNKTDLTTARITTTKGKTIWASDIKVAVQPERAEALMICLSDREREMLEAVKRAEDSDLRIYHDFAFDTFVVRNLFTCQEYTVVFKAAGGKALVSCTCPDFKHRNRICKHAALVLRDFVCSIMAKFAEDVYLCQLCNEPSTTGWEHRECEMEERFVAEMSAA